MISRRVAQISFAMISLVCVPMCILGCEKSYTYEVRGTIKSAIDGMPLAGVAVTLQWAEAGIPPR
jgi:hypothetical protein